MSPDHWPPAAPLDNLRRRAELVDIVRRFFAARGVLEVETPLLGAAAATDILIPPSIAFIVYAVLVPGVSVPAIFAAGMFPGILAGIAIIVPIVVISILKDFGGKTRTVEVLSVRRTFREAFWGLMAPVVILGGMRIGAFTPTEAAVMASISTPVSAVVRASAVRVTIVSPTSIATST